MKITQFRKNGDTTALSVLDLEKLVNKVKTEIKSRPVSTFREELRYMLPDDRCMFADKLPEIIPAAEFRKVNGQKQMKAYNGIIELTVGPLSNKSEIALVKQKASEQPQTRCAFMGSSGKTVKIWTTFTRPDNSLPKTREEAELFHAHAYRLAVKCYQPKSRSIYFPKSRLWSNIRDCLMIPILCIVRIPCNFISRSPQRCPKRRLSGRQCRQRSLR